MLNFDRPAFESNPPSASCVAVLKNSTTPMDGFRELSAIWRFFAWTLLGHQLHKTAFARRSQLTTSRALFI
jgi:hypothetical protein